MSEAKTNKDGLLGGQLVSPKDHAAVLLKKRQAANKPAAKTAK